MLTATTCITFPKIVAGDVDHLGWQEFYLSIKSSSQYFLKFFIFFGIAS